MRRPREREPGFAVDVGLAFGFLAGDVACVVGRTVGDEFTGAVSVLGISAGTDNGGDSGINGVVEVATLVLIDVVGLRDGTALDVGAGGDRTSICLRLVGVSVASEIVLGVLMSSRRSGCILVSVVLL